jgi:hypothetical protein
MPILSVPPATETPPVSTYLSTRLFLLDPRARHMLLVIEMVILLLCTAITPFTTTVDQNALISMLTHGTLPVANARNVLVWLELLCRKLLAKALMAFCASRTL